MLRENKNPEEEILIEKAVKTSIQILFHLGLSDNYIYVDADELLKSYLLQEFNETRRSSLDQ